MVDLRPYADLAVVKQYISNVKISETTIQKVIDRAASDVEAAFHMNGAQFSDTYVYINSIKSLVENKAACMAHKMYGDRNDAKIYCEGYENDLAKFKLDDTALDTEDEGTMEPVLPETYPSNLLGSKLQGRNSNVWTDGVPTP